MDQKLLVDSRISDGLKFLSELVKDGFDVTVACWVRDGNEDSGLLYVGSTSVKRGKVGDAYAVAYDCLSRVPDASIELSDIKLVPVTHPVAKAALALRERHPGKVPFRANSLRLAGLEIQEAYVYPRLTGPWLPLDLMRTLVDWIARPGSGAPAVITLKNGAALRAFPVSVRRLDSGEVEITFRDATTNVDRVVSIADVASIQ